MRLNLDARGNLIRPRQGETDYDEQRECRADAVNQFLHVVCVP